MKTALLDTEIKAKRAESQSLRPVLKWAGGKTQLLKELHQHIPDSFNNYIEPFFGGGALYFSLNPKTAVIADSNPELINLYTSLATRVEEVIRYLRKYKNDEVVYYEVRSQDWTQLPASEAAARTIFLNKTCFNGLYRVNKKGGFNVPFGFYKNPNFLDLNLLRAVSASLVGKTIVCGDYLSILDTYAEKGDLVFLDPPYIPVGKFADFKRYTKEQFGLEQHAELANKARELVKKGCYVILTNSNNSLVHELFADFKIEVIQTKRHISCHGDTRTGEDTIITSY
jgi:DNA adenine methylase